MKKTTKKLTNKAILFCTDNTTKEVKPKGKKFSLEELYQILNCELVEVISLGHGFIMIIDEEGKLCNKSLNKLATMQAEQALNFNDYIVGDAIICSSKLFN